MTTITDRQLQSLRNMGCEFEDAANEIEELREALSAPATAPAQPSWHDAPTVPGLWMGWHNHVHQIEAGDLRKFSLNSGLRWFGPIPEDKP